jgi:vacuolar-type H+-ATPase subunit H
MRRLQASAGSQSSATPLLELIRREEAEVLRRLAGEEMAGQAAVAQAEQRAREIIAEAEAEGRREGEAQCRAEMDDAEREAAALVARARAEAERRLQAGQAHIGAAVARALHLILGG